jgi:uncharacterized protein (TIGR03435 family)
MPSPSCRIAAALAAGFLAFGQTVWQFEVASVKPAGTGGGNPSSTLDPSIVSFRNTSFKSLLLRAYMLRNYQIEGPGWIDSERYDVAAKVPAGAPRNQVPAMLRELLAARFRLVTRRETRQEDVFILGVGKEGPKLTKSQTDFGPELSLSSNLVVDRLEPSAQGLAMPATTVAMFANTLATLCGRPVLDETGIEGVFDINLHAPASAIRESAGPPADGQASEPTNTLAAAIKELGLTWSTRKAPIEHLVVESATKAPIGN